MARPPTRAYSQLPVVSFVEWDRVYHVEAILRELEYGSFMRPALLADQMFRDDRISAVLETRQAGLVASPMELKPAAAKRKALKLAEIVGGSDDAPGLWETMCPASAIAEISQWGNLLGIGVGEWGWTTTAKQWTPRLKPWHPQFVTWDWGERRYRLQTAEGAVYLPRVDEQPRSDGKWFVWTPFGYEYGWLRGMLRSLSMLALARGWNFRDWSRYNEKHGQIVDKVYSPEQSDDPESKDKFFNDVANRGSDSAILIPVTSEGRDKGYDVELMEAQYKTYETFKDQIAHVDTSIAIRVLGQNLTTEVQEGSRAAATVQDKVRVDKRRADAKIAAALRDQGLTWWAQYNYGDPELAPRPEYQVDPPEDELAEATALKTTGEAISALKTAGAPIDMRAILDRAGVPMISEDDGQATDDGVAAEDIRISMTPSAQGAIITVNEARRASGLGPLLLDNGSPDPDGDLTIAQYNAKAGLPAPGAPTPPGQAAPRPEGEEPEDDEEPEDEANLSARMRARQWRETMAAIMRLASRDSGVKRTAAGKRRAKVYQERLAEKARALGRRALAVDLTALKAEIDAAKDFDDLKARVLRRFKGMDPAKLAKVVEKAQLMGALAGRLSAIEEI